MRGFRKLLMLGIVLVTLLVVIDMIDAGKKETKKKESHSKNVNYKESKKNIKLKKSTSYKPEDSKPLSEEIKLDKNKINEKKNVKKGSKTIDESDRFTKTYQKVKKYKVVKDGPAQKFASSKTKHQTIKSKRNNKEETIDEVVKSLKKTSQKKISKEKQNFKELLNEEPNSLNNEKTIINEEGDLENIPRRKKYNLVEDVLQDDDGENQEVNETIIDLEDDEIAGIKRTESEEVVEKYKTTHTLKLPKRKTIFVAEEEDVNEEESAIEDEILESDLKEELSSDVDSFSSRYEDPNDLPRCKPLPEDPNRDGPKKVTLYVVEEEVDGQIKKKVVSEEDGVTMCEVADLLQEHYYYSGLP